MATYQSIVMTGGTSLFAPANIFGQATRDMKIFEFDRANPRLPPQKDRESAIAGWLEQMASLTSQSSEKPQAVSAEYSLLHALSKEKKLARAPEVLIFFTDTFGGEAAARLLEKVIAKDFSARVSLEKIEELDVANRRSLNRSLGRFMQKLGENLREGNRNRFNTCFAPLGGYKVMTSFGYIAGAFYGYPTAYLHEEPQVLHEIPPVPIEIDSNFVEKHSEMVRRFLKEDTMSWNALSDEEKKAIESYSFFFERVEEMISLNAFGRFIFMQDRYAPKFQTRVFINRRRDHGLRDTTARKFAYAQIHKLICKLKTDPVGYRSELHHEASFDNPKGRTSDFSLYKGSSHGPYTFRATWRYDENEDHIYVNYMWLNHAEYERDVAQGIGFGEGAQDYQDISAEVYQTA